MDKKIVRTAQALVDAFKEKQKIDEAIAEAADKLVATINQVDGGAILNDLTLPHVDENTGDFYAIGIKNRYPDTDVSVHPCSDIEKPERKERVERSAAEAMPEEDMAPE